MRTQKTLPANEKYPTADETKQAAMDFLKAFGLFAPGYRFTCVVDNTQGCDAMSVGVILCVDGVPCSGAGAKILVDVGRGGNVVRALVQVPDLEEVGKYEILDPREAFTGLTRGHGQFMWNCRGTVADVSLVYHCPAVRTEYLLPAYVFECLASGPEDEPDRDFIGYMDALQPKYLGGGRPAVSADKASGGGIDAAH